MLLLFHIACHNDLLLKCQNGPISSCDQLKKHDQIKETQVSFLYQNYFWCVCRPR